jgi:OmpA-OmpF porin, OOP family
MRKNDTWLPGRGLTVGLAALALGLGSTSAIAADQSEWYAGFGVGYTSFDVDDGDFDAVIKEATGLTATNTSHDDNDIGYKIFGGYRFHPYIAAEIGYVQLGTVSFDSTVAGGHVSADLKSYGLTLAAVGILPVNDRFEAFGKLGGYWNRSKAEADYTLGGVTAGASDATTNMDLFLGIGATFYITQSVGIRAEWEWFSDVGDADVKGDVNMLSASVQFRW